MGLLDVPAIYPSPICQRVMHLLSLGRDSVTVAFLGDSLGDTTVEYPYRLAQWLGSKFPAYAITYRAFGGTSYGANDAQAIQAGTGTANTTTTETLGIAQNVTASQTVEIGAGGLIQPQTTGAALGTAVSTASAGGNTSVTFTAPVIKIYNACVSGTGWDYLIGKGADTVKTQQPDLIFIMHSHNEGTQVGFDFQSRAWAAIETIARFCPDAEIVLCSENREVAPATNAGDYNVQRGYLLRDIAARRGFGFVDVAKAFDDTGNVAAYLNSDGVHPKASGANDGEQLIVDTISRAMLFRNLAPQRVQLPPAFLTRPVAPIYATDFQDAAWDGTSADFFNTFGWTNNNVTATQDLSNFEAPAAYGVQLQRASSATATITYDVPTFADYAGEIVTFVIRAYVPSGQAATVCRPSISDGRTVAAAGNGFSTWSWLSPGSAFNGRFVYALVQGRLATNLLRLRLTINVDSTGSTSPAPNFTLQRVCVSRGRVPRDYILS